MRFILLLLAIASIWLGCLGVEYFKGTTLALASAATGSFFAVLFGLGAAAGEEECDG